MGISFLGNTSDFKTWFFTIDGKTFVANNSSTLSPLRMSFTNGRFFGTYRPNQIIPGVVLVKNHSFDIITGTSNALTEGEYSGIVEWTWAGIKHRNAWKLSQGDVIREGVPEEGDLGVYSYDLNILRPSTVEGYVPYDGPTGGAVGTGVVNQKTVETQQNGSTSPSSGGSTAVVIPGTGMTSSPIITTPPAAVASTDWVKLALQVGAAYLLLA